MTIEWTTVLNASQITQRTADCAKLDPSLARQQHTFYASRNANQLRALASQAWLCNERDSYVLANSYLALLA